MRKYNSFFSQPHATVPGQRMGDLGPCHCPGSEASKAVGHGMERGSANWPCSILSKGM